MTFLNWYDTARQTDIAESNTHHATSSVRRWSLAVMLPMLLGLICFSPRLMELWSRTESVASADVPGAIIETSRFLTKPIEQIRPGDRVLAHNPDVTSDERAAAVEPDRESWRLIEMLLTGEDGHEVHIRLIRPLEWINQHGAVTGGTIPLDMKEIGAVGYAGVLDIQPCPPIEPGNGEVVTGAFRHVASQLVEVHIAGEPAPIVCTTGHPFWSEDRQSFVDAAELKSGEHLRTADNRVTTVRSITPGPEEAPVFNIEVNTEHVYFVGDGSVLVHNNGECEPIKPGWIRGSAEARQPVGPNGLRNYSPPAGSNQSPGHTRSKHGWDVDNPVIVDVRNHPDKVYIGTNDNGNDVIVFWRDGDVVITSLDTTSVITAYGKSAPKLPAFVGDKWASDAGYSQIH